MSRGAQGSCETALLGGDGGGAGIQGMWRSEKSVVINVCDVDPLHPKEGAGQSLKE